MRYFFDFEGDQCRDDVGIDLPDMAAVRREAVRGMRDFLADRSPENHKWERLMLRVSDERGDEVLNLQMSLFEPPSVKQKCGAP